jgi:phosphatidylserine/phosphatidylglycerophosphate/cardiolipin synthase-like enzyme
MFGLSDPTLLQALASRQVATTVYYDPTGSPSLWNSLPFAELHPVQSKGLMHQKILVCDQETVFIGSANMTAASLSMHDNLMIGLKSPMLARFLIEKVPGSPGYFRTAVGGQEMELWLLPDPRGHALNDLKKKIRSAKKSLQIALFTLTHPTLLDEIIDAHRRGVYVCPIIDMHSGLGASKKAVEQLRKAGIRVLMSKGIQLLHHKFILIDKEMLVSGSANWTKAAFYKNSDCFFALHHLKGEQKAFMERLWNRIESEAKPVVQKKKIQRKEAKL